MTTPEIKLFGLSTCAFCQAIRKMLTDLAIPFLYIEVDQLQDKERKAAIKELKQLNPKCSFPTTVVKGEAIIGYQVQEIKEKVGIRTETDDLYDRLKKINEPKGYHFNANKEKTFELLRGLMINKDRYGYMSCPCRLASGDREKDKDIICPCDYRKADVEEYGSCYCSLYVSEAWNKRDIERKQVPERRPEEKNEDL